MSSTIPDNFVTVHSYGYRYETIAESTNTEGIKPPKSWKYEPLEAWLLEQARGLVPRAENVGPSDDLFQHGFDRSVLC